MAPKKAAPVTKEEAPATAETETETKAKKPPKPTKLKTLVHPSTLAMVVEVLKKNSEKKGTSVPAIRARILAAHPTVDPVRLKFLLRAALYKGIEKGILVRPLNSSATGATGRFKLAKPLLKTKAVSNMSENVDPNGLPKEKPKKKVLKVAKPKEAKPKEPKEKSETASKKEKSSEKPKASKPKKEPEEKPKVSAAPKKPKAKTAVDGETKTKKEPAKKEKAEEKETTKVKDSEGNATAKSSKKGKK
ncbi:PREDICTED: protein B4 [Nanorana parkeri]|uniref:protein B4 n=1 Tax=Nanorana parkeri TaxID=125878 RepID=UPI000854FB0F|nr:PREDICTED: protein B4 [Nanorana parkeri]